jgi:tetratricopeptide (TPR) repeat protein
MRSIGMVALLLLTAVPTFLQGAGKKWDILNQEVMSLYQKGQYDRAVIVAKKALEVAEKNVGKNPVAVATSLNNLAELYDSQGQYAQAEPLLKRSLEIREKALGPDHPAVAIILENIAVLYRATNRTEEADALDKRATEIRAIKR